MYKITNLENVGFLEITNTWNSAFSDYIVPVNMTPCGIEAYFKVTAVDKSQSFGAYHNGELVGLLVNSVDNYKGGTAAFDAMTGIVPGHRGKGLFSQLFDHTKKSLMKRGIANYYIEVITTNENAYAIYKKKGGKVVREFSFLTGKAQVDYNSDAGVKVTPLSAFRQYELSEYEPSFGNRVSALHRNIAEYKIAHIEAGNGKSAAIFSAQGGIPQINFGGPGGRAGLHAVLAYLSLKHNKLNISNIPITETELIGELLNIGFQIAVNQYEMRINLSAD